MSLFGIVSVDDVVPRLSRGCHVTSSTLLRIPRGNVRARKREISIPRLDAARRSFTRIKQQTDRRTNGRGERRKRERDKGRSYAGEVSPSTGVDWRASATSPIPAGHPLLPSAPPPPPHHHAHSRGHPPSHANSHFIGSRDRARQTRTNFPKIRFNFPRPPPVDVRSSIKIHQITLKATLNGTLNFHIGENVKFVKCEIYYKVTCIIMRFSFAIGVSLFSHCKIFRFIKKSYRSSSARQVLKPYLMCETRTR